uniref:Prostaglandin E synthase 2 n=2 Tax=Emiliania huxleyi TaxID=2903 RepID=A0A7S3SSH2_EMIHU|mmetsp:Transcript_11945/g.35271  ORF Transcript_11945/g.35271 Transcript_11945/m.35271 type:complete len:294 (-) Transcript_11945:98-979(-)
MSVRAFTRIAAGGGGLLAAGFVDRALTPQTRPLSTAAAAAGTLGHIRLYQYQICPFCNKIKALLDLHGLEYETVDVNPLTKKEIKPWSEYRKVPIAVLTPPAGGEPEQINDSPVIAERLLDAIDAAALRPARAAKAFRSPQAMEWAQWSDAKLAVLLFPNITRSFGEAYQAFGYVQDVPHFSTADRLSNQVVGAFAMWMAQGKIKKKYAIDDERQALRGAIHTWVGEGLAGRAFAGGDAPHYGDVCVYGCLRAIDRTAAHAEILDDAPELARWYGRMEEAVGPSKGSYPLEGP